MIHISNISDCNPLLHDPGLYREVTFCLLYYKYELMEDEEDDHDFNFSVIRESDLSILNDLGTPEETVQFNIKADGHIISMYRIIHPTEALFIPAKISDQFSQ